MPAYVQLHERYPSYRVAWLLAQGLFGLGLGDAPTAQEAVAAAYLDAFNKLTSVPLYRGHTIFNHIEHKYNSLKVRSLLPHAASVHCFGILFTVHE